MFKIQTELDSGSVRKLQNDKITEQKQQKNTKKSQINNMKMHGQRRLQH